MAKKGVGKSSESLNSGRGIFISIIVLLIVASAVVIISNVGGDESLSSITGYAINSGGCNEKNVCNAYGDVIKNCAKTLVADCQYGCTLGVCDPAPEPTTFCGDGICNGSETIETCSQDCSETETTFKTVCETSSINTIQCCKDNSASGTQRRSNCCDYVCANKAESCTLEQVEDCNYFE